MYIYVVIYIYIYIYVYIYIYPCTSLYILCTHYDHQYISDPK